MGGLKGRQSVSPPDWLTNYLLVTSYLRRCQDLLEVRTLATRIPSSSWSRPIFFLMCVISFFCTREFDTPTWSKHGEKGPRGGASVIPSLLFFLFGPSRLSTGWGALSLVLRRVLFFFCFFSSRRRGAVSHFFGPWGRKDGGVCLIAFFLSTCVCWEGEGIKVELPRYDMYSKARLFLCGLVFLGVQVSIYNVGCKEPKSSALSVCVLGIKVRGQYIDCRGGVYSYLGTYEHMYYIR